MKSFSLSNTTSFCACFVIVIFIASLQACGQGDSAPNNPSRKRGNVTQEEKKIARIDERLSQFKTPTPAHALLLKRATAYLDVIEGDDKKAEKSMVTIVTGDPGLGKTFLSELMAGYAQQKGKNVYRLKQGGARCPGGISGPLNFLILDDVKFDITEKFEAKYDKNNNNWSFSVPDSLKTLARWLSDEKVKGVPVWVSSNVKDFRAYLEEMKRSYDQESSRLPEDEKIKILAHSEIKVTIDLMEKLLEGEGDDLVQSFELKGKSLREGLTAKPYPDTQDYNEAAFKALIKSFQEGGVLPQAGGSIFVSTENKDFPKDVVELYLAHRSGYLSPEKGRIYVGDMKIFDNTGKFTTFHRAAFENQCLLIVKADSLTQAQGLLKEELDHLALEKGDDEQSRDARAGYIDRIKKSTLFRFPPPK